MTNTPRVSTWLQGGNSNTLDMTYDNPGRFCLEIYSHSDHISSCLILLIMN